MKNINAIIVEDHPIAEDHLKKLLKENCPQVNIIASFQSGKEAIKYLPKLNYDLLFLDIEYNDNYNAFQMLEDLDFSEIHIIFTTAFDTYRRKASEAGTVKYLLKPINKEELMSAVERSMLIIIGKEKISLMKQTHEAVKTGKIVINSEGESHFIEPNDIVYLKADGAYTDIFHLSGKSITRTLSTQNIGKFERILNTKKFIRVHKKYIVNISFVKKSKRNKLYLIVDSQNIEILISKDRRKQIIENIALNNMGF